MGSVVREMVLDRPKFEDLLPGSDPGPSFDTVELKFDGRWGQLLVNDTPGRFEIWSRHGRLKTEGSCDRGLPRAFFHGEEVAGTNWAKKSGFDGHFRAFAVQSLDGADLWHLSGDENRNVMVDFPWEELGLWARPVSQWPASEWRRLWDEFVYSDRLPYEGLVFKHSRRPFGVGWGRMKRLYTVDYVCLGFNTSDSSSYRGQAKSIIAGLYVGTSLRAVCNVMGLTERQRADFSANPDQYIGRVFIAEGKGLFDTGALRHPNFVDWHAEKRPEECVLVKP